MLLELPRRIRDMTWKKVHIVDRVVDRPFHFDGFGLCDGYAYDQYFQPRLETLLTCKQIYEEAK